MNDITTEGTYVWTDGTTFDPSVFVPAAYYSDSGGEDCGIFYNNAGTKWYSVYCQSTWIFSIVEFDCPQG